MAPQNDSSDHNDPIRESRTAHFSVIIPSCSGRKSIKDWIPSGGTLSRKALVERSVDSVLKVIESTGLTDAVEILVGDDETDERIADHLKTVFSGAISKKILQIVEIEPRTGDAGVVKNTVAWKSTGSYLHFLDPFDRWLPTMSVFMTSTFKEDLIFSSTQSLDYETDWIRSLLLQNFLIPSSIVIKRSLFEEAGGFPTGYGGLPLPKRPPGLDEYELLLLSILAIPADERKRRINIIESYIQSAHALSPGRANIKEFISSTYLMRKLPKRYWPYVGKKFVNLLKSIN